MKKYRRIIFHDTGECCKVWRKLSLVFKKSDTCEEGEAHFAFIDEFEKQIIIKKTVEVGQ